MKNRRIIRIFGIILILSLLLIALPAPPALAATYAITLTPATGKVGDTISFQGTFSATAQERFANIYFSPTNITAASANITSALIYTRVANAVVIPTTSDGASAGLFSTTFVIPSTIPTSTNGLEGGTVAQNVVGGTYYVYVTVTTINSPAWVILVKTTFTVTQATLDPLSPATGPAGTSVVVSGSNFPASTPLVFTFDTTIITPTSGHTSTMASGLFLSTITIPAGATATAHTLTVTAGTGIATATFTVTATASATLDPPSPATGLPGISVVLSGSSYPASTALVITFDTTVLTPTAGSTVTGTGGSFTSIVTIPATATAGAHVITVTAGTGTATTGFTVSGTQTTPPPTTPTAGPLSLDQTGGAVGSTITIGGSGFIPNQVFTVTYDGVSANITGTTQANGFFFATFEVPSSMHGIHIIAATDGTNVATANFTVESTAPQTPQPLRPYMDEAVASPISFDWADGTDASSPVTYKLQIATTPTFDTNTVIISVTGFTASTYTLTATEEQTLTTGVTYYWREKAVDAAFNESDWTGANTFSITIPFSFTGWPLYVTIGFGALLLFLLGLWLGRRSAYNY